MTLAFTADGLDRADNIRADPQQLAALRASPDALLVGLDGLAPVMDGERLAMRPLSDLPEDAELVFLGLRQCRPLFAHVTGAGDNRPAFAQKVDIAALSRMERQDLAIYGTARALVDWHGRHRFCANCGAPTQIAKGGWQRDCPACEAQHFPRTDPVAIMLVEHDGALLLARGKGWPDRIYSALAGFIEPGETVEQAVAREVLEETGIAVRDASYLASQPWPFPSQLMIGCHSLADSRNCRLDETELADARWFTREDIAGEWAKGRDADLFLAANPAAIAHHLVKWWMEKPA
ncbi:NAD(+) diphosphatase [Aurantiacibacter gangjinensis]|uniref:NAD(+) diphosphatase n=1 Tax=Aurantiacibacter gangjinensis TaxID=502682 RepID=A0A0G9MN60_9SPHN|nr:NAD(+) diphosphatase [Aurantiacibacter gangjinensis]APE28248.1 NADH pyrophosphatase [Aurantiacibacter gangjinensis]KLE32141.1 NUDIX hydrolase [Aurantiacibacter gangjinensis]